MDRPYLWKTFHEGTRHQEIIDRIVNNHVSLFADDAKLLKVEVNEDCELLQMNLV